jgi:NAD(P)-dependent dehydrogenase (short-subunit alcohol dehydrogenase family)
MQTKPTEFPKQQQGEQPGHENEMSPRPEFIRKDYKGSAKLAGKAALITGGDSGIGRSVAIHFAREGADIAIVYLNEDEDALETKKLIEKEGRQCLLFAGDITEKTFCSEVVNKTRQKLGNINILVNNAAEQHEQSKVEDISAAQLERTFRTNIFSYFYFAQECVKNMVKGDSIINTTSITAYRGSEHLMDYASTKGAIVGFTRSLSANLAQKGIRVNGVAPGPIWTPLIPASFDKEKVSKFGQDQPMGRAGQPSEVGPSYVFLASEDASYITGQIIHPNGGEIIAG